MFNKHVQQQKKDVDLLLTAFTAGGIREAEIATPTNEEILSPKIPKATAAPDNNAVKHPTHKVRTSPLKKKTVSIKTLFYIFFINLNLIIKLLNK